MYVLKLFPSLFGGARKPLLSSVVSVDRATVGLQARMNETYASSMVSFVTSRCGRERSLGEYVGNKCFWGLGAAPENRGDVDDGVDVKVGAGSMSV